MQRGGLSLISAYLFLGMVGFQLLVTLFRGGGDDPLRNNGAVGRQAGGVTMPAGRSPGSISAIYAGLDQ